MFAIELFTGKQQNNNLRAASGQPLGSLMASDFWERFYYWRGTSDRFYVCSIFECAEEATVAEFSDAVIIGVANEALARQPICLLASSDFDTEEGRRLRAEVRSLGVNEWHVHFVVDNLCLRDLASAFLN
jgi:hypothetical protein